MQENVTQEVLSSPIGGSALPLATALSYATGVAAEMRERQKQFRPRTSERSFRQNGEDPDLAAFGAMLYELIAGSKPPTDLSNIFLPRVPLTGHDRVRAAAIRLALQCLGAGDAPAGMQQVLTEMRIFSLMARQSGYQQRIRTSKSVPPPQFQNSLATLPDGGMLRSRQESIGMPQRRGQLQRPAAALPPRFQAQLRPGWLSAPPPESILLPDVQCPRCNRTFVHLSRPRTVFEYLLVSAGIDVKLCHRCMYRYIDVLGMVFPKRTPALR